MKSILLTSIVFCLALGWTSSVRAQENPNSVPLTNAAIENVARRFKESRSSIIERAPAL